MQEGLLSLTLHVRDGLVEELAFSGLSDPEELALLEKVRIAALGVPLREAADHAAIYALHSFVSAVSANNVHGIRLTANSSPLLAQAERLLRHVHGVYGEQHGPDPGRNSFDRGISKAWANQSMVRKIERVQALLDRQSTAFGMDSTEIRVEHIDSWERIFLDLGTVLPVAQKPAFLLAFEHLLRRETAERLEVFLVEMKDLNEIRREHLNHMPGTTP